MLGYKSSTGGRYRLDSRADARLCKPCRTATSNSGILVSLIAHFPYEVIGEAGVQSTNRRTYPLKSLRNSEAGLTPVTNR